MRTPAKPGVERPNEELGCRSPETRRRGVLGAILISGPLVALMLMVTSFGLHASPGSAATVTLAWNPNAEASLAGYTVYYGTASRVYPGSVSVSSTATNITINNLQPGLTYYFAITALNIAGLESGYSTEVTYAVPVYSSLQIRMTPNRRVILTVTGVVGHTYAIQATTNVTSWTLIGNATVGVGGVVEFTDTNAPGFARRFYRTQDIQP